MNANIAGINRVIMGRLPHGSDLLDELAAICEREGVNLGQISAIGAMQKARIGYYNQESRRYEHLDINEPVELLSLTGNVSMRDNKIAVHAHVTLADRQCRAFGGHLSQGTVVFACEYVIVGFEGSALHRKYDEKTGLPLWDKP